MLSVVVGALGPSESRAQDTIGLEGSPTSDARHSLADPAEPTDAPEREHVELSFGVAPALGGLGHLGALGGLGALGAQGGLFSLPVAVDVAVPLGSRALLSFGGGAAFGEGGGTSALTVHVAVSVLAYLDRPRTHAFLPTVRVQVRGAYAELSGALGGEALLALGVGARGGLTYLFDDAFGIRAELGAGLDASFGAGFTGIGLDLESAFTLVLRA